MFRVLAPSPGFRRGMRRLAKKNPAAAAGLQAALLALSQDAVNPALRTHKLKGDLAGKFACSAGYDVRLLFALVPAVGGEEILLISVGTHDEVY